MFDFEPNSRISSKDNSNLIKYPWNNMFNIKPIDCIIEPVGNKGGLFLGNI